MPGRKPKDKTQVDIDYIVSWALYHSKMPVKKIAQERGQTKASIYWQIKQVDTALEEKLDMGKLKDLALLCYPAALESLIYNLQTKKDASVTNNYLNKTIFADVKDSEQKSETNIFNLTGEHQRPFDESDLPRLKAVMEFLQDGGRKDRTSPVGSRIKGSQKHKG